MQLPAGFEDMLRGASRGVAQEPSNRSGPLPARHGGVPTSAMDVQQLTDMLDAQFRLREAAQASKAQAVRALVALAEALCPNQWDGEKRAGHSPEDWPPERIGEFVIRHTLVALQQGYLAQQPDLAADFERTARELTAACDEISRLKLQLHYAQEMARIRPATQAPVKSTGRGTRTLAEPLHADQPTSEPAKPTGDRADIIRKIDAVSPKNVDAVIRTMVATGLSRSDKVREYVAAEWRAKPNGSRVGFAVRAAVRRGLVDAIPCTVEWPGEKKRQFLKLTPAGLSQAAELGVVPVESEFIAGLKLHKTATHLYLVLKAADILRAEGFEEVNYLPECLEVANGDYCPDVTARQDGRLFHVEVERSQFKQRETKWSRAAESNNGRIYLVTPNLKVLNAITSEITATTGSEFQIWAFSITEYVAGTRGADGSIWTHRR